MVKIFVTIFFLISCTSSANNNKNLKINKLYKKINYKRYNNTNSDFIPEIYFIDIGLEYLKLKDYKKTLQSYIKALNSGIDPKIIGFRVRELSNIISVTNPILAKKIYKNYSYLDPEMFKIAANKND